MKPFNLEAAKNGAPIITRDGRPAKFVGHFPENVEDQRVAFVCSGQIKVATEQGKFWSDRSGSELDLFMASVKKEGWIPLYRSSTSGKFPAYAGYIYATKDQAEQDGRQNPGFIQAVHISWEE